MNLMYLVEMDGWTVFHEGAGQALQEPLHASRDGEPPAGAFEHQ